MAFKDLSDNEIEYLSVIYTNKELSHNEKLEILTKKFGVVGRTIRNWASKIGLSNSLASNIQSTQLVKASERNLPEDVDIVLVTSALNKTPVSSLFMNSLHNYKEFLEGRGYKVEIVIIPIKYRNPTIRNEYANKPTEDWWVDEVEPYLYYNKVYFYDTLISANSRVVPTASLPLNGYESLAADNNLILGHPRLHFKTLPRFKNQPLRTMNTTGFCTVKSYSKSKAGDKAYIHHTYGFTIVEKKNEKSCYPPRLVKVNGDGVFIDLIHKVSPTGVEVINKCKGIVLGDIHKENLDENKMEATYRLMESLLPETLVLHDLFDGSTVNPHERKDMYISRKKIREGRFKVDAEINEALDFVETIDTDFFGNLDIKVVQSNHDDFLDKWVNEYDWKKDLHNSAEYLRLASIQQTENIEESGNIFGYLLKQRGFDYIKDDESFFIQDYQVGAHGHNGINGARGSVNSLKKLNQKLIIGHVHSPAIIDSVTAVGVSCNLWQYYNSSGLSSWAQADCIIHENGKNQLVVYDSDYEISDLL